MPMHDWTVVDQGIYHAFHFNWIGQISQALNRLLPKEYYALPEQRTGIFGPDILALKLQLPGGEKHPFQPRENGQASTMTLARPKTRRMGSATEYYLNKQRAVSIRHVSGDQLIAVVEIVSPGNKSSNKAVGEFITKVINYLKHGIHVSFVDPFLPTNRDPFGLHAAIWEELEGASEAPPENEQLEVVAYERANDTNYFVEPFGIGGIVPNMPVFLQPGGHVLVPMEETYLAAFEAVPARWREVVAGER